MKVSELMKLLKTFDPDTEVCIAQPTHNHWRQVAAPKVRRARLRDVVFSAYNEEFILCSPDAEPDEDEETKEAVVLE